MLAGIVDHKKGSRDARLLGAAALALAQVSHWADNRRHLLKLALLRSVRPRPAPRVARCAPPLPRARTQTAEAGGVVGQVLSLVRRHDARLQLAGTSILAALASGPEARSPLMDAGALVALIPLCVSPHAGVQVQACRTLRYLIAGHAHWLRKLRTMCVSADQAYLWDVQEVRRQRVLAGMPAMLDALGDEAVLAECARDRALQRVLQTREPFTRFHDAAEDAEEEEAAGGGGEEDARSEASFSSASSEPGLSREGSFAEEEEQEGEEVRAEEGEEGEDEGIAEEAGEEGGDAGTWDGSGGWGWAGGGRRREPRDDESSGAEGEGDDDGAGSEAGSAASREGSEAGSAASGGSSAGSSGQVSQASTALGAIAAARADVLGAPAGAADAAAAPPPGGGEWAGGAWWGREHSGVAHMLILSAFRRLDDDAPAVAAMRAEVQQLLAVEATSLLHQQFHKEVPLLLQARPPPYCCPYPCPYCTLPLSRLPTATLPSARRPSARAIHRAAGGGRRGAGAAPALPCGAGGDFYGADARGNSCARRARHLRRAPNRGRPGARRPAPRGAAVGGGLGWQRRGGGGGG